MMILCLTGTNPYSFLRLVSYVDETLGSKYKVIVQLGNTRYKTNFSESFDFCEREKIFELIDKADLVITQGGYGSMTDVMKRKKKIIAVPREKEFNESQDNQKELVDYFASKGYLVPCYNVKNLAKFVSDLLENKIILKDFKPESQLKVSDLIEDFLENLY